MKVYQSNKSKNCITIDNYKDSLNNLRLPHKCKAPLSFCFRCIKVNIFIKNNQYSVHGLFNVCLKQIHEKRKEITNNSIPLCCSSFKDNL